MPDKIRLALIGTGGIAQRAHIPAWQRLPEVEIVALAEPVPERRQQALALLGDPTGERIRAFPHIEPLLETVTVDLVDITIPPGPAKEAAIRQALAAGCHVTCQKPFTRDLATAVALTRLAQQHGRLLSINQQARYAAAFARAREWIATGRLGTLRTIQLWADFPNRGPDQWLDYSVHSFDLLRFWAGQEPRRVLAWHKRQTDRDQYLLAVWLDFDGVLAAQIWDEMAASTTLRWGFRLMGERGTLRGHEAFNLLPMLPAEIAFCPAGSTTETVEPVGPPYVPHAFAAYFAAVVAAVRGLGPPPVPAEDNLRTLRLAFAAHQAAAEGRWVTVETTPATS